MDKNVDIEVNGEKVKSVKSRESELTLGVYMSPSIIWTSQFEKMKEKMLEAMYKLKNATMVVSTASMYYNMYLIKKVYFGCGVISIMFQLERILKKIYEPIILKKLGLSENFPRAVLYSRKTALGVGLIAPRTIINELSMKLYLGYRRADDRISKII